MVPFLLLIGITALTFYWLCKKCRPSYMDHNIPPFPCRPLPLLGHVHHLFRNYRQAIKQFRAKVGDIFSLDMAGRHLIVVCGYENINDVYVKHGDKVLDSPFSNHNVILREGNKGIFVASGANWKEQKYMSIEILRSFGMRNNILAEKIQEETAIYISKLSALRGMSTDVSDLTCLCFSNIICSIIMGKRFDHEDTNLLIFMRNVDCSTKLFFQAMLISEVPFITFLPGDVFSVKKYCHCIATLNDMFATATIEKIKKNLNEDNEPENFISAYLKKLRQKISKDEPTLMNEDNLAIIVRDFFLAGTVAANMTILWCLVHMLHNPQIQEKVYREIVHHVGTERFPNIQDKHNLSYLNAVIMETQRIASVVPFGMVKQITIPFEVKGYTFPKNSLVVPYYDSVMLDERVWGDPDKFRPERFLNSQGNLLHPAEFIPFSIGRRICPGEALAKIQLFLFLSAIFQRFELRVADEQPSLEAVVGVNSRPKPFKIRLIER